MNFLAWIDDAEWFDADDLEDEPEAPSRCWSCGREYADELCEWCVGGD